MFTLFTLNPSNSLNGSKGMILTLSVLKFRRRSIWPNNNYPERPSSVPLGFLIFVTKIKGSPVDFQSSSSVSSLQFSKLQFTMSSSWTRVCKDLSSTLSTVVCESEIWESGDLSRDYNDSRRPLFWVTTRSPPHPDVSRMGVPRSQVVFCVYTYDIILLFSLKYSVHVYSTVPFPTTNRHLYSHPKDPFHYNLRYDLKPHSWSQWTKKGVPTGTFSKLLMSRNLYPPPSPSPSSVNVSDWVWGHLN